MKSNVENPETGFLGSITSQSIRNLLPKSISNHQSKMNFILSKSKFSKENTPPSNPNVQIDNPPTPSSDLKKSITKSRVSQKEISRIEHQKDQLEAASELSEVLSDQAVKVVVRIRPTSWREKGEDWDVRKASAESLTVGDRTFKFDAVVDSSSTQEDIFQLVGVPLVKNSLAGFNTSVLTYGQTGSGKTFTMWGPPSAMVEGHLPSSNQGIVPRIFQMLFAEIQKGQENPEEKQTNYQCRCSFLEVYNEQIGDLLDPSRRNLQIGDNSKNGFYVDNLSEEYVTSYDDVTHVLIKGLSNRKVGATSINSKSSRSHIMFTCVIESWRKNTSLKGFKCSRTSRISFVDLAGSDRNQLDDEGSHSIKEGKNVKKSLAQLGHLVHVLAEKDSESGLSQTVPYKSSCLTHLLQESLGGNTKLTVICAISPHDKCKGETLSTVRFGQQAKSIKNMPVINEVTEDDVNDLSDQIRQLKEELIKEKSNELNLVSSNSGYFKGRNARESLNQLRLSLNRSIVLPHIDNDSEEEMEVDEDDVNELCVQLNNVGSSCEENSADTFGEADCHSSFESCSMATCMEDSHYEDCNLSGNPEDMHLDDVMSRSKATDASKSSLSVAASRQPLNLQEPPLSESPKIENSLRKSTLPLSKFSASPNLVSEGTNFNVGVLRQSVTNSNVGVLRQSVKRSEHIRESLRSSKIFSSPTEALAASLHRGLQIIDSHQKNSGSNNSSVALSFEHLAWKTSQAMDKSASGQNLTKGPETSFVCASCKRVTAEVLDKVEDSLNLWVVQQVDKAGNSEQDGEKKLLAEAAKREELEKVCAEQAAKIEQLNQLVEQYKNERQHNTNIEQIEYLSLEENKIPKAESDREVLLTEIEMLKNKLQSYEESNESQSIELPQSYNDFHSSDNEEIEEERRRWTEKESEWICLTDELRVDLESYRRHAEKMEMELRLEKKVIEELDDALDRSVYGHARFVEHYADLQDKYNELLGRHQKIMEAIAEVKKAAVKAGKKGNNARFVKSLATELSALRVEREKEREHLKKENRSLRIQLRDTAEAVHAAGELLVRLREAEEAISVAEENYMRAQQETEKVNKKLEKQRRKHAMEMVTMKQYLAESKLPESALRPVHWDEEDRGNTTTTMLSHDDQAWRSEFGAIYQEHY